MKIWIALCVLSITLLSGVAQAAEAQRPNVVLIMADDLGVEGLGCYGGTDYKTPNLDAMAAAGVRFTHCYSQPLCTPSRVQIMTGKYNFRNYKAFGHLDPGETTFAHILKAGGYRTCVVGKWQLWGRHDQWVGKGSTPAQAGFDYSCVWQIEEKSNRYADPGLNIDGNALEVFKGAYGPEMFTDYAVDFIQKNKEELFFLYFPMALTHNPFTPTPDSEIWAEGNRQKDQPIYLRDMVAYMDTIVGRISKTLEDEGIAENTLLLFTTDNGTHKKILSKMEDGGKIQGNKGETTDAGTHVPLIAHWPGHAAKGVETDDLVDFSDFLPTFLEVTGVAAPVDHHLDGQSFLPQVLGKAATPREWIYCYYKPDWGSFSRSVFARDQGYKLYEDGRFYHVATDPLEEKSLDGKLDGEAKAAHKKLQAALERYQ